MRAAGEAERLRDVRRGRRGGRRRRTRAHRRPAALTASPSSDEAAGAHATGSGGAQLRAPAGRPRAPYTRSGRAATTLDTASTVMTASPRPMTTCQPVIAAASEPSGIGRGTPDGVEADERQRGRRDADEGADAGRDADARQPPRGKHRQGHPERRRSRPTPRRPPCSSTLVPRALTPAVGEEEGLHGDDDRQAEGGRGRTDEHRSQRAPEQVTGRAGPDREVDHLGGEDEDRDQAGQRRRAVVELVPGRPHQAGGDDAGRHDGGARRRSGRRGSRRGRARVAPCRSGICLLHIIRNKDAQAISRPRPPTSESPAGACVGRVTSGARSPCTVLLARRTIRVRGEVHGGERPGVDPHPLQPGQARADRLGHDRLDRVAVAHGHPDGVRAVRGLDLGVEGAHPADDPLGHLREGLGREDVVAVGRSPPPGRPGRRATAASLAASASESPVQRAVVALPQPVVDAHVVTGQRDGCRLEAPLQGAGDGPRDGQRSAAARPPCAACSRPVSVRPDPCGPPGEHSLRVGGRVPVAQEQDDGHESPL